MNRMHGALVGTLLLRAVLAVEPAEARQAVCLADSPAARRMVDKFLTSATSAPTRQEWGMGSVSAADVRVLTDDQDAAVCRQLNSTVAPTDGGSPHYFYAGGFYFVAVFSAPPAGQIRLTTRPLLVLDSLLNVKGVVGT